MKYFLPGVRRVFKDKIRFTIHNNEMKSESDTDLESAQNRFSSSKMGVGLKREGEIVIQQVTQVGK